MINLWIGNLAKYNEGRLIGEWVTLPMDEDELQEQIEAILGNDEEYFLGDWETEIDGIEISEYSSIVQLNEIAQQLEEFSEYDLKIINTIMYVTGVDFDEAIEVFNNGDYIAYEGTIEDVVYDYLEQDMISENTIRFHFDSERLARDLQIEDYEEYEENEEPTLEYYEEQAWELLECGCVNAKDYVDIKGLAREFDIEGWYEHNDIAILVL